MSFPARLQAAIGAAGITQAELARAAGVSGASVSDWVRGVTQPENLKAEPLLKAARRLHVNPDWLLIGTGPQHRHGPAARLDLAEP
jgi:transcriptional regulator with XRE-family HTH domain